MMNVGKNRAQNGVLDCPESKNEEKFLSIDRMGSSRFAVREAQIGLPPRYATGEAVEKSDPFIRLHAKEDYSSSSRTSSTTRQKTRPFYHLITNFKPLEKI
ncbi:hypothetical protein E3N88_38708 [Mikania micrantha]|uniref:Uncharacterized protein n=1 Tax=Mikania micrantha TaxID=192012 RepID=A0A5N6LUT7_9ASTR|nr:hypothetical protein E3N88_38708 [Mikania micrantha]